MPISAKDYRKAPDEASRNQLFMMFVAGKIAEFDEDLDETSVLLHDVVKLNEKLSRRIWVLENKHLPKAKKPKVKVKPVPNLVKSLLALIGYKI